MAKGKKGKKTQGGSIEFKATTKGLDKVKKDADKAGSSFNTLDKNARSTDRAMKGVSNMSSNTTKNFSKMSQGITGGLVPAYATLAAQLFALDALFRFLREAADFRVLQEGQEAFAGVTGRAMKTLAKDIQTATAAQVTFKEASQAAAIGLAAGLSPSQLNELGEAAKVVSVALGRDTTDSFNRLIRGVTKAEPELLDELGIILRLDEATRAYAAQIGTTKEQLTTFQKSQAVANDVLMQAETRYGAINQLLGEDSVNQLNKLMVAFDEVLNRLRSFIGPLAEFFGDFLTNNIESATAAIGVFAASITGGLIRGATPTVDYGKAGAQAAAVAGSGDLKVTKRMSEARIERLATPGAATKADIAAYEQAVKAKESIMIKFEKKSRKEHEKTVKILKAQRQRMVADAEVGFEKMKQSFKADLYEMQAEHGTVMGSMKFAGMQFGKAMSGIMSAIGFIGIAVMLFQMAKQLFNMFRKVDQTQENLRKRTEELTETQKTLNQELEKTQKIFESGLLQDAGQSISQVGGAFQSADLANRIVSFEVMSRIMGKNNEEVRKFGKELLVSVNVLQSMDEEFRQIIINGREQGKTLSDLRPEIARHTAKRVEEQQAVAALARAQQNSVKQINALAQALPKVPFQEAIDALEKELDILETLNKEMGIEGVDAIGKYDAQMDIANARLTKFKMIADLAFQAQTALNDAMIAGEGASAMMFGDAERMKNAQDFAKGMEKLLQASTNVITAENNLLIAIETGNKSRIKSAERQIELAQQALDLEFERLATIEYNANKMLSTYRTVFQTLEKDLGTAFGKILRGETDAFKDFGKKFTDMITNALGDSIAKFQLKLMFGGTPLDPDYQREEFVVALKKEFAAGFSDPDSPFMKGGFAAASMIKQGMIQAAQAHVDSLSAFQLADLKERQAKAVEDRNQAETALNRAKDNINALEEMKALQEAEKVELERLQGGAFVPGSTQDARVRRKEAYNNMIGGSGPSDVSDNIVQQIAKRFPPVFEQILDESGKVIAHNLQGFMKDGEVQGVAEIIREGAINPQDAFNALSGSKRFLETAPGGILTAESAKEITEGIGLVSHYKQQEYKYDELYKQRIEREAELVVNQERNAARLELAARKEVEAQDSLGNLQTEFDNADAKVKELNSAVTNFTDSTVNSDQAITKLGETADATSDKLSRSERRMEALKNRFPNIFAEEEVTNEDGTKTTQFTNKTLADGAKFATGVAEFGGFVATGFAMAGEQEKAAKLMQKVAQLQFSLLVAEKTLAFGEGFADGPGGFFKNLISGFKNMLGFRYGGMTYGARYGAGTGGIFDGPESGYNVRMHGNEAVVPLGNDRAIPVKMEGSGGTNNVNVTVNVDQNGQSETLLTGDGARKLGKTIAAIAQDTIAKEQRAGGLLSNI